MIGVFHASCGEDIAFPHMNRKCFGACNFSAWVLGRSEEEATLHSGEELSADAVNIILEQD